MPYARLDQVTIPPDQVGLALAEGAWDAHIAIAFRTAVKHELKFLHFFQDGEIRCEERNQLRGRRWIATLAGLSPLACKPLVGIVQHIANNRPRVPLGLNFRAAAGSFKQGTYEAPSGSDGLTCASFVAEVFRDAGYKLVDEATWPQTFENLQWGNAVHKSLRKQGAQKSRLDEIALNNNALRLHPFEVGAVGEMPSAQWPVTYPRARQAAAQLTELWNQLVPAETIGMTIRRLLGL